MPIVMSVTRRDTFSSVWLKGVRAVDLNVHCMESLIGNRYGGRAINNERTPVTVTVHLAPGEKALYLCGVTYPYRWADNAHLALLPDEDAEWHGEATVPGLTVTVQGARPVWEWGEQSIPTSDPHYYDKWFRTCRNWQFAHWAHGALGLADEVNPYRYPTKPSKQQAPLFRGVANPGVA